MPESRLRSGLAAHSIVPWAIALGGALVVAAVFRHSVILDVAATWLLAATLVVGWVAFCGPAQEVSLGHALFFGGAGYLAGLLQLRAGAPPLVALGAAILFAGGLGAAIALLTARHRGLYFSMITMAIQIAGYRVLFLRSDVLGGEEGLTGISAAVTGRVQLFLSAAGLLFVGAVAAITFLRSKSGLLLAAVGQNETLARSLGVRVGRARALGLTIGAAIAGAGGAAWSLTQGYIGPDQMGDLLSARVALLASVGGLWSVGGAVTAALSWEGFRFALARFTELASPISAGVLLGLVAKPSRSASVRRPRWDGAELPVGIEEAPRDDSPTQGAGLVVRDLSVRFGGLQPLKGVSFAVARGKATGIIGPNGCGKSTLLNAIAGLVAAEGEIVWRGRSLGRLDTSARARVGVRKTFQHAARFPELSVWEHLQVATVAASSTVADSEGLRQLVAMCEPVRGRSLQEMDAATLRLVEMAMTLVAPPDLLLLDEPFAGLSREQADAVTWAIRELRARGTTILIVEHRLDDMFAVVDDLMLLGEGDVMQQGTVAQVMEDPAVRRIYLGH